MSHRKDCDHLCTEHAKFASIQHTFSLPLAISAFKHVLLAKVFLFRTLRQGRNARRVVAGCFQGGLIPLSPCFCVTMTSFSSFLRIAFFSAGSGEDPGCFLCDEKMVAYLITPSAEQICAVSCSTFCKPKRFRHILPSISQEKLDTLSLS